jgi:hypothetical protein
MGNATSYIYSNKSFYVYKRRIDTDAYVSEPVQTWDNIEKSDALARFKHEFYAMALQKYGYDVNTKAIYLYYGSTRLVRAAIVNNQVVIEAASQELQELLSAGEQLAPSRGPLVESQFERQWFRNYARLSVNSVGYVRNSKRS